SCSHPDHRSWWCAGSPRRAAGRPCPRTSRGPPRAAPRPRRCATRSAPGAACSCPGTSRRSPAASSVRRCRCWSCAARGRPRGCPAGSRGSVLLPFFEAVLLRWDRPSTRRGVPLCRPFRAGSQAMLGRLVSEHHAPVTMARSPSPTSVLRIRERLQLRRELLANRQEGLPHPLDRGPRGILGGRWFFAELTHAPARPGDREPLVVQELLHLQQLLHVAARVDPLATPRLLGPNGAELRLPVAQSVTLHPHQLGDLADAVVELDGDLGRT